MIVREAKMMIFECISPAKAYSTLPTTEPAWPVAVGRVHGGKARVVRKKCRKTKNGWNGIKWDMNCWYWRWCFMLHVLRIFEVYLTRVKHYMNISNISKFMLRIADTNNTTEAPTNWNIFGVTVSDILIKHGHPSHLYFDFACNQAWPKLLKGFPPTSTQEFKPGSWILDTLAIDDTEGEKPTVLPTHTILR